MIAIAIACVVGAGVSVLLALGNALLRPYPRNIRKNKRGRRLP